MLYWSAGLRPAALLGIQLPANASCEAVDDGCSACVSYLHEKPPGWNSRLLSLTWPSPGFCRPSGSEAVAGRSLSSFLFQFLSVSVCLFLSLSIYVERDLALCLSG